MEKEKKDPILKNIAIYSSSHIYRNLLGVFSAFIKPKLLTPELYGLWNILNLICTYASYAHLGTRDAMRYSIPYHESKKEYSKNKEIKGSVFYSYLYLILIFAAVLVFISFTSKLSFEFRLGLLAVACIVLLEGYYKFYMSVLKSYQEFKLISTGNYIKATVGFISSIVLIYLFSIYGIYISVFLTLVVVIFYFRLKYPRLDFVGFRYRVFLNLLKMGFPIMLFEFSSILIQTSDRLIVSYFLGIKQLGYYAITSMVFGFFMDIPGAAREVVEPKLMEGMATNTREKNLNEYFLKPLINTAYFMPFLIGPIFFIFPVFISVVLPRYTAGIVPTQIIAFGGYFLSLAYTARGIIIANNWQLMASIIMIVILPINVGLSILFIKLGLNINGVAIGSSISYFILFISLLLFIRTKCNFSVPDWRTNIMGVFWPFPVMCITISALETYSKIVITNNYLAAFVNLIIFYIITYSVINIAQKRYPLIKKIRLGKLWNR